MCSSSLRCDAHRGDYLCGRINTTEIDLAVRCTLHTSEIISAVCCTPWRFFRIWSSCLQAETRAPNSNIFKKQQEKMLSIKCWKFEQSPQCAAHCGDHLRGGMQTTKIISTVECIPWRFFEIFSPQLCGAVWQIQRVLMWIRIPLFMLMQIWLRIQNTFS